MATPARIGYQSYTIGATATGSTEAEGFEADSVTNPLTYERWKPTTSSGNVTIDFGSAQTVNYIALAAHTFGTNNKTVTLALSSNGSSFTTVTTLTPDDDRAIFVVFGGISARYVRVSVAGGTVATLGVVYAGMYLEMYRPFYADHAPINLSRNTTVKPNKSVNGQWVGRSVYRQGLMARYNWKHTPIQWYIDNVEPFSVHAQTDPFFIQWNPDEHPDQVGYVWTSDDIKPVTMGVRDLVEFGFSAEGIE